MKRKIFTALLAAVLLLSIPIPVWAEEAEDDPAPVMETITIANADDFLAFAHSCVLDSWSQNKQVILEADIDLERAEGLPIPTFGGIFDGNGHSITGLKITQAVTPAGLFGYLQPTAVVRNLQVRGTVTPDGECSAAGGIAGENYGTIESCRFSGIVAGDTNTGEIVGSNWGILRDCSADGSVTGSNRTGGICGYNNGQITSCKNAAMVNTESVDPTLNPTKLQIGFTLDFSKLSDVDVTNAASDTGGIAGYSSGSIVSCENAGSIGYPHIGYNLGGIAGRNCGYMEACENKGEILGRKDVGGVVGQLEPHIQTVLSPDYLETLSKQFESLGGLVSNTGSAGSEMGSDVQDCIQIITAYQSAAQSAVGELASSAVSGEINENALGSLSSAVQGMVNASGTLKNEIGEGVDTLADDISAIAGQIGSISRTFALATEDAKQETITDLSDADLEQITEGRVLKCINSGRVEADLNVGGIAGSMSLESTADPEDDMPSGSLTQRRRFELKAIADACENVGTVTAKRSYVGGICGRMELGLITKCRGYGHISSEGGDYVGGIAGLAGGTIRDCFAKCTLSGNKYIGGIVGSGISEDYQGDSSLVSGCYSMVDIPEYKQFAGAVSGANTGVFVGNFFVSDSLAGIDRVSYTALAEPISYEKMQTLQELPQSLQELTLRFVADGQTVKTIRFHYGDSFDDNVYPEIPQKEGCYARWNIRNLTNLRFDTVVEANYLPYITALNSTDSRIGDRPVFFVQGHFQEKDILETAHGKTEFHPGANQKLLESWHLSIPADGLASHTIRYLPGQENIHLYLLKSGSWSSIQPENIGSYLAFEAAGSDVDIAVVAADSGGRSRMLMLAGILALLLFISILLCKRLIAAKAKSGNRRKSHLIWILIVLLLAAAIGAAMWLFFPKEEAMQAVHIYDIVKAYLQQPEQKMQLTVTGQIEERDMDFSADIDMTTVGDHKLSIITQNGRSLYYSDGTVFVENGDAFRLSRSAPDYSELLGQVLELSRMVQMESADGLYSITAEKAQSEKIAQLLMPSVHDLLPDAISLSVEMKTEQDELTQVRISGAGNLTDSEKTPFSVSAILNVLPPETVQAPKAVTQKILSGNYQAQEVFSDELVQLIHAWTQLRQRESAAVQLHLTADCGPLTVDDNFLCYQWNANETRIYGTDKTGTMLYYGESKICSESGTEIYASNAADPNIAELPDALYKAFRNAQFKCRQTDSETIYTVTLQASGMKELAQAIFPQTKNMNITFRQGNIRLVLENGEMQVIEISCNGNLKIATVSTEVSLGMDAKLADDTQVPALPEAVKAALAH